MGICYDPNSGHGDCLSGRVNRPGSEGLATLTKLPVVRGEHSPVKQSPLQQYLREISKYPLLDPEEELELAKQHFEGDDREAAHRLVTANLRLVVKIANDFRQAQIGLLDLIQEGNYGLMQAVKRFNPYKGVKLSTYAAWWIRAYILKHIMENKSQVKMGTTEAQRKLFYNLEKMRRKLLSEFEHVDVKMLAEALNVKEEEVVEMQKRLGAPDVSMDAPIGDSEDGMTRGQLMASDTETAEDLVANGQLKILFSEHVNAFRETLKGRDLEIFDARLLADEPLTLQELGDRYGISRERARQLEVRIIKNLRDYVNASKAIDIEIPSK